MKRAGNAMKRLAGACKKWEMRYNKNMTKKEMGILAIIALFVAGLVTFGILTQKEQKDIVRHLEEIENNKPVGEVTLPPDGTDFVSDVPDTIVETTPDTQAPAAPGSSAKLGVYELEISENGFVPSQIVVKKGDIVGLKITARDGKYDFTIPYLEIKMTIEEGETKQGSFRADAEGIFSFECNEFCPSQGVIKGAIVVKE